MKIKTDFIRIKIRKGSGLDKDQDWMRIRNRKGSGLYRDQD
jgi:hypothetical protein